MTAASQTKNSRLRGPINEARKIVESLLASLSDEDIALRSYLIIAANNLGAAERDLIRTYGIGHDQVGDGGRAEAVSAPRASVRRIKFAMAWNCPVAAVWTSDSPQKTR